MGNKLKRHEVFKSDRIKVTEKIISKLDVTNILEIGAGDYSFKYLKNAKESQWTTVDFAMPCDIFCDLNSDSLVLPFEESLFDLVICTEMFEHLLWPQQLLKEVKRILRENGLILVSVPNITSLTYRIAWLLNHIPSCAASGNLPIELGSTAYKDDSGRLMGGHVIDFNLKRIIKLIEYIGFKPVIVKGSGIIWHRQIFPHWLVPPSLASNIICLAQKT
jgi:SAM-dependent methyltransferase